MSLAPGEDMCRVSQSALSWRRGYRGFLIPRGRLRGPTARQRHAVPFRCLRRFRSRTHRVFHRASPLQKLGADTLIDSV